MSIWIVRDRSQNIKSIPNFFGLFLKDVRRA